MSVVIGAADLGDMFAHEVDQCCSCDIVACAINDCVEYAAEMRDCCQTSIITFPTSYSGRCLNITRIKRMFTITSNSSMLLELFLAYDVCSRNLSELK